MSTENALRKFRHKTIRRFRVAEFEFDNYHLELQGDAAERFVEIVKQLPQIDSLNIVEVNEEAQAAAEKSLFADSVVRGAQTATQILTEEDRQRLAVQQGAGSTQPGATNTTQTGNSLAGAFSGLGK